MSDIFNPTCLEGCRKVALDSMFYSSMDSPVWLYAASIATTAFVAHVLVKALFD